MGFFSRLIVPEIDRLQTELAQAKEERDWYRDRCNESGGERLKAESALRSEINRNRKREDLLQGQILELAGGKRLPVRIEEKKPEETPEGLSPMAEQALRDRAREYCTQRYNEADITEEKIDEVFEMMKLDPEEWLKD